MAQGSKNTLERNLIGTLILIGTVMLVGGTDMTKVVVALPSAAENLSLSPSGMLWLADTYPLAAGAVLVLCAVAADRFGRKRIYLLGLVLALLSAVVVAIAPTGSLAIIGRIGQGVGAALLIAGTVAIIRVTFPGIKLRGLAYGVWVVGFSTGSALGPLIGGSLVEVAGWRWVFWINVPILLACLLAATLILRESKNPDPPRMDPLSAVLAGLSISLLISGMKSAALDFPSWYGPVAIIGGLIAVGVFVARQRRLARPFLDISLLSTPLLAGSAVVIAVTIGVFNGALYVLTQELQTVEGLSAVEAGVALLPLAVASAVGGLLGPGLHRWLSQQQVIVIGLTAAACGFLLLATVGGSGQQIGMLALGIGGGVVMAVASNALMTSAPEHRTADAGAIQESAFTLGAGTGIAVLGSWVLLFEAGATAALGFGAFLYVFFALGAGVVVLNAATPRETNRYLGDR